MGFPCTPDTKTRSRNDAAAVAMLLKQRHEGHFMLWNLAEEGYDYGLFDNQVRAACLPACLPACLLACLPKVRNKERNAVLCLRGGGRRTASNADIRTTHIHHIPPPCVRAHCTRPAGDRGALPGVPLPSAGPAVQGVHLH